MKEQWVDIPDFPGYAVSDQGHVMNTNTDRIKDPAINRGGILMVNLSRDRTQHVRSVAVLVAKTFMEDERPRPAFDTPINLDGDRKNCAVENLMWRPRWFAVKYHQQFDFWYRSNHFGFKCPVEDMATGEVFPTSWEAATKYGLIDVEIFEAVTNNTYVFPTNQRFRVLEE